MEKCDSWNCPFCNWGYCTGDKEYACEIHFCTKQNLDSELYNNNTKEIYTDEFDI